MWNTLDSYGGCESAFFGEEGNPVTTESKYKRHEVGGEASVKETNQAVTDIIGQCEDKKHNV